MPNTIKIDIDAENWPKGYWDRSLRCIPCEINWPCEGHFMRCPQCDHATKNITDPPDMRWPEAVKLLLEERFEAFYKEWKEEKTLETLESFSNIVEAA